MKRLALLLLFEVVAGELPQGLAMSASGQISGQSEVSGTHYFTIRLTSGAGVAVTRRMALHVLPSMPVQALNTVDEFFLPFEGGYDSAPGLTFDRPINSGPVNLPWSWNIIIDKKVL